MKVSVIYVNYNTTDLLCHSLESLKDNFSITGNYEVIVVDNASNDFRASKVKEIHPKAIIREEKENLGFGRANNMGAQLAKGEYLWLLNTDTIIPKDNNILDLIDFLDENQNYAAASPLLLNEDGSFQEWQVANFQSVKNLLLMRPARALTRIFPGAKGLGVIEHAKGAESRDVDIAVAASLLIRRQDFEKIGGFSPEYFMYYEDSDLCKKIARIGKKIRFFTRAKVIHLLGKSTKSNFSRKKMYFQSQDIYFKKWHNKIAIYVVKLFRIPVKFVYWFKHKLNSE